MLYILVIYLFTLFEKLDLTLSVNIYKLMVHVCMFSLLSNGSKLKTKVTDKPRVALVYL